MLIGRIHWKKDTSVAAREAADNHVLWQWLAGVGLAVAIGVWLWLRFARIGNPPTVVPAAAEADMEAWFGHSPTTPLSPPADFSSPPTEPLADTLPVAAAPPSALPPTTTETRTP
ncbi:MAG: hypothetical protein K8R36_07360 [Planctomycetales bacterium]|nr:hypothetical protein [Planctomycetales bacterium]